MGFSIAKFQYWSTGGWFSHAKYRQPSNKLFFVRTKQNMFFWPQKSIFPQHKCKTWAWKKIPQWLVVCQKTCNSAPGATLHCTVSGDTSRRKLANSFSTNGDVSLWKHLLGMPLTDGIMSKSISPGSSHLDPDRTCLSHADASRKGPYLNQVQFKIKKTTPLRTGLGGGSGSLRSRMSAWRLGDIFLRPFNVKIIYIPSRT